MRGLSERDKEVGEKVRASAEPFDWVTSGEFDCYIDNAPIVGNFAHNVSMSVGDLIHVVIPSDCETSALDKGRGPTSLPFTRKITSATAKNCYCGSVKLVLPLVTV